MNRKQDQIRGCLWGSAAGDALGYCVGEMTLAEIRERFGPEGLRGYDTINGLAPISSHTQMAMYTANGLLFGATRGALRGVMAPYVQYLWAFYLDWLKTQHRTAAQNRPFAWLNCIDELHARRSPDPATVYALERGYPGTMDEAVNRARGPAGLTRCPPIGLFLDPKTTRREETVLLGAESAALTQGDALGFLPAAMLTDLLSRIVYDPPESFRGTLAKSCQAMERQFLGRFSQTGAMLEQIKLAHRLAREEMPATQALEKLNPTDAPSVLAGACYVCLRFPGDFDRGLVAAVNHSGASAAVGAVTGAILGAQVGAEGIPEFYLEPLELREIIGELADDLFQGCPMSRNAKLFDDLWDEKYIQRTH